jgi:MFS family permease
MMDRYFPALKKRNFRIFWTGQCVSLIGTWMETVGQSWLVLELTGSPLKLGFVSACQFLPVMIFSLFAGPLVDRFPKRRMLIITQSALLVLALILSVLTATGLIRYWMVLGLALLLGCVNTVDTPTRQAFVIEMAGRDSLMNAVSLNSAAFNTARILGPAVAGILIGVIGIAPCFFINALSFGAVIIALTRIQVPDLTGRPKLETNKAVLANIREGLSYIRERPNIIHPLAAIGLLSTFVINYNVMVPTFARDSLGRDAKGYGFLMTAMGIGSLAAALTQAMRSGKGPKAWVLYGGGLGMSLAMLACGLQRSYILSCVLLAIVGYFTITMATQTNATIQLLSDDEHRGRVMSVYSLVFGGVTPIGALYAGALIDATNASICLIASGAIGIASTLFILYRARKDYPRPNRAPGA